MAKRLNRIVCEHIRCMLSHSKLPKLFWGYGMRTPYDLINLSLLDPLDGNVREIVRIGKHVSHKHLRVFDCRAYIHIRKHMLQTC